jgi:ketosteroid isomerase-like protein
VHYRNTALAAFLLTISYPPFSDSPLSAQTTSGPQVDAILAYERAACAAYERNDAAAIDSLVHDSYTLTDSKGVITGKADDLRDARTRAIEFTTFHNEDMKVRIFGNSAVVTGRTILKGRAKDGSAVDIEVQFTDTVILIDGRWRIVAGHVSRLKPKPA